MSISSISNSSNLRLQTLAGQQRRGTEKPGHNIQADISHLTNSLRSGDLEVARSDYATITSRMPADRPAPDTEFSSALDTLGAALGSGDLDAAREALASVQELVKSRVAQGPPPPAPPDGQDAPGSTSGTTPTARRIDLLA